MNCPYSLGQEYTIMGKVVDKTTGEPISFANVVVKGKNIGTAANDSGYYTLTLHNPYDTLIASLIGYEDLYMPISQGRNQVIDFYLEPSNIGLSEVVIWGTGERLEDIIFRKIQEHKPLNNNMSLENYSYKVYNKMEVDLKNVDEKTQSRKLLRPFSVAFSFVDSTTEEEPFLPMFFSESFSDFYYTREPKRQREVIYASKISGTKNESISQLMGGMYVNYNIYDNGIVLLDKEFISPIAKAGKLFYDYAITDTLSRDGVTHYRMDFVPKSKSENTFIGYFIVSENNYAIKEIVMKMAPHVNINFVKRMELKQTFTFIDNKMWMLESDNMIADFIAFEKAPGIIGRKTALYYDFILEKDTVEKTIKKYDQPVTVLDNATEKDIAFWQKNRPDTLSKSEAGVYAMVDSIQKLPAYNTYVEIINLALDGYKDFGPIGFGPIGTIVSNNSIDGWRFRLGMHTNSEMSERIALKAFGAYGLKSKAWYYGGNVRWLVTTKPRQILSAEYNKELDFKGGIDQEMLVNNNILAILYRRKIPEKLTTLSTFKASYQYEWKQGYSAKLSFIHRDILPTKLPFYYIRNTSDGNDTIRQIHQNELVVDIRMSPKEIYLDNNSIFRSILNSPKPVVQLQYRYGIAGNIWKSQFTYHRIILNVTDEIPVRTVGKLRLQGRAGKTFGNIPYLLSELHPGNETYFYYTHAFSMMNQYEFYSDMFISLALEHHFEGFFLNKIPGIRKLKIREVLFAKGVWGNTNQKINYESTGHPMYSLGNKPYAEVGFGLENILKFFQVDCLWRLTYRDNPYVKKFGIRVGIEFNL